MHFVANVGGFELNFGRSYVPVWLVRDHQKLPNTAARRSIPGCVKRNLKNFNKKAPELKLVGYPFLYIPVDIPPVSPRRGLR